MRTCWARRSLEELDSLNLVREIFAVMEEEICAVAADYEEEIDLTNLCIDQPISIDPEKVRKARGVELHRLETHGVYNVIPESALNGRKVIQGRWVDEDRGEEGRSRIVAKDFRIGGESRPETFAGTPDGHIFRYLMSEAATHRGKKVVLHDAERPRSRGPGSASWRGPSCPRRSWARSTRPSRCRSAS